MDQDQSGSSKGKAVIFGPHRRRGRPRKYEHGGSSLGIRGDTHMPPGFSIANDIRPYNVEPIHSINPGVVGQAVSGVIEGEFDEGYLLTVQGRNSDVVLRGVVFKPERCAPITADNDVAPDIQMIPRNEVPSPGGGYSQVYNAISRWKTGSQLASPSPPPPVVLPSATNQESSQLVAVQVVHPSADLSDARRKIPRIEKESTPEPMEQDDDVPDSNC